MLTSERRVAYDTRNELPKPNETIEQAKKRATEDFASYLLEQAKGNFKDRINVGIWNFKLLSLKAETQKDWLEANAACEINYWIEHRYSTHLVWVSFRGRKYVETRIEVLEKDEEGIIWYTVFPADLRENDCLNLARALGASGPQDSVSWLRAYPLPFNLEPHQKWPDRLKEHVLMPKGFWEYIENGKHKKRKLEILKDSKEIVDLNYFKKLKARGRREHLEVGALMEKEAERRGHKLQSYGPCDATNTEVLSELTQKFEILPNNIVPANRLIQKQAEKEAKKYDYNKKGICSICNREKWVCPPPKGCNACYDCTVSDNLKMAA